MVGPTGSVVSVPAVATVVVVCVAVVVIVMVMVGGSLIRFRCGDARILTAERAVGHAENQRQPEQSGRSSYHRPVKGNLLSGWPELAGSLLALIRAVAMTVSMAMVMVIGSGVRLRQHGRCAITHEPRTHPAQNQTHEDCQRFASNLFHDEYLMIAWLPMVSIA